MSEEIVVRIVIYIAIFALAFLYGRYERKNSKNIFIVDFGYPVSDPPPETNTDEISDNVVSLREWKKVNSSDLAEDDVALTIRCDTEIADWLEELRKSSKLPEVTDVLRRALKEYEWRLEQTKAGHQHAIIKKSRKT